MRTAWALALLAGGVVATAQGADARRPCGPARVSGTFFAGTSDGRSWTLIVDESCGYKSLHFSGDPANDVVQPTRGTAKLAQVDGRDVLILQSAEGEFADVLTAVQVGPRLYLVPTNQHLRFCIDWTQKREPRKGPIGRFLLRAGGETTPVASGITPAICQR